MAQAVRHALQHAAVKRAGEHRLIARQHRQQPGQIGRAPSAIDVRLGESDIAAGQHLPRECPVGNEKVDGLLGGIAEAKPVAIGGGDAHRAVGEAFEKGEQETCANRKARRSRSGLGRSGETVDRGGWVGLDHRVVSSRGGAGLRWNGTRASHNFTACQ